MPDPLKATAVGCVYCNALPGEQCVTAYGNVYDAGFSVHVGRQKSWLAAGRPPLVNKDVTV